MSDFDEFWKDPRIPREMKRCGKPPVKRALAKTGADPEHVLASLPFYAKGKPDYQDFCHLSTYINQERYEVWLDPEQQREEAPASAQDQADKLHEARVNGYRKNGYWHPGWGPEPIVDNKVVELKR